MSNNSRRGQVVTVTPTIQDGQVVRWYQDVEGAAMARELISASRNGVIGGQGTYLTPDLFSDAWSAHARLKMGEDVNDLATHQRRSLFGELEAVSS